MKFGTPDDRRRTRKRVDEGRVRAGGGAVASCAASGACSRESRVSRVGLPLHARGDPLRRGRAAASCAAAAGALLGGAAGASAAPARASRPGSVSAGVVSVAAGAAVVGGVAGRASAAAACGAARLRGRGGLGRGGRGGGRRGAGGSGDRRRPAGGTGAVWVCAATGIVSAVSSGGHDGRHRQHGHRQLHGRSRAGLGLRAWRTSESRAGFLLCEAKSGALTGITAGMPLRGRWTQDQVPLSTGAHENFSRPRAVRQRVQAAMHDLTV